MQRGRVHCRKVLKKRRGGLVLRLVSVNEAQRQSRNHQRTTVAGDSRRLTTQTTFRSGTTKLVSEINISFAEETINTDSFHRLAESNKDGEPPLHRKQ